MKKLSKKIKIIIIIGLFVFAIALAVLKFANIIDETVFMIFFFICIMGSSTLISSLFNEYFQKKLYAKKKGSTYKYDNLYFEKPSIVEELNFGIVEIYFEKDIIYNLNIVNDSNLFFAKEKENMKSKIDMSKYKKSIEFYIFKDESEISKKILFNYQGKDFFIASFIINEENKTMYHIDDVMPNEDFKPYYDKMLELLKLEEITD